MASPAAQDLLERWRTEKDFTVRNEIFDELVENNIFPGKDEQDYEVEAGLYPDIADPNVVPRLMRKREFQESKQPSIKQSQAEGKGCRTTEDFEITPVQRFISRFLGPRTPYNSALLYHGVGVGKTCAAVTVCESYLKEYPGRKIYIVAPPNIQEGFKRTIFDREALTISASGNHHRGCTGDVYLNLTGSTTELKREVIVNRVARAIKSRYEFFGYTSFYNKIYGLLSSIRPDMDAESKEREKYRILREEFSNRVIVIDEAHNLRDNPLETEEDAADDTADSSESKAGKKLTPYLRDVLDISEGITLLLMTATPMYNSYLEIVFLLNLLLSNDKFENLRTEEIFDIRGGGFVPGGERVLGRIASRYVSFMRGENPLTFPIRLEPQGAGRIARWPRRSPKGDPIDPVEGGKCAKLPILLAQMAPETEALYKMESARIVAQGLGITNIDILVQAGNWIFPGRAADDDFLDRVRQQGFENTFVKEKRGNLVYFTTEDPSWLLDTRLSAASGKCAELLRRLVKCQGVSFIYSRFVPSGALSIALALEANGYTCWNRDIGFLGGGNQHPEGRQCALCQRKEKSHGGADHGFKPAKYILLTGSEELSPNNARAIDAARSSTNTNGEEVKVIIGSQIAGEGLDLRYIREIFVFDSWYHLNKLEQIIGRGIRNCSHAALDPAKRNCTITLLVNSLATELDTETIDMYSYRLALKKAVDVGRVSRVLKEYAIDCSLNREAILIKGLDPITLVDSQGVPRPKQPINDVPLTPMCDWLETCDYDCRAGDGRLLEKEILLKDQDSSTYDEYTARYQMSRLRAYMKDRIVRGTPFVTFDEIANHLTTIPRPLIASLLDEIVGDRETVVSSPNGPGYIIFRNGYYLFQPEALHDMAIPIALRTAHVPIPRDRFTPKVEEIIVEEVGEMVVEEDSEEVWEESLAMATAIRNGSFDGISNSLLEKLGKIRESSKIIKDIKERLDMIQWVYDEIADSEETREFFAATVLEYMWDEYITAGTKRALFLQNTDSVQQVAKDSYWEFEGKTYIRLVNSFTNEIEYICDGQPCSKAIVEVLERETRADPLLQKPIDLRYTGFEYGFIIHHPKKKTFVFKKAKAPLPGKKVGRGSECSINSGTEYERKQLGMYSDILLKAGRNDLGLSTVGGERRIQNSVRVCTVSDLTLRYMDRLRVGGKRWFYRPLEAKLHNHPLR